jgi:chromosome segregation ATPase
LPAHPRLRLKGWVDPPTLLKAYAGATAAYDWMGINPERALAFSFRHADYLGCGLPILTHSDTALTDLMGEAGWASDDIERVLDEVLDDEAEVKRRGRAARAIAKTQLSVPSATRPLVDWVDAGSRHGRTPTDLLDHAQLAANAAQARASQISASQAQALALAEVSQKRAEIKSMVTQIQSLTRVVDRLSRAVDEVAGFKREAITVLGNQSESATRSLTEANQEITLLRADISKKSAELSGMDDLRLRLEHDIENLSQELRVLRGKGIFRR